MSEHGFGFLPVNVDDIPAIEVGAGCSRRDLPSAPGARAWIVDIASGHQWPHVDVHDGPELVYVVSGDLIEGEKSFGPGSYLLFEAGSRHRPRTANGVRLFGLNLRSAEAR